MRIEFCDAIKRYFTAFNGIFNVYTLARARWKRRQVENPVKKMPKRKKDLNKDSELASNANRTS